MWIYLSPHLDDAIFSCGGIIAQQVETGAEVEVWTLFAGKPPVTPLSNFAQHLHNRYGYGSDPIGGRIAEDKAACSLLGIKYRHFPFLEAIYRQPNNKKDFLYPTLSSIFDEPNSNDTLQPDNILQALCEHLKTDARLAVPLGIGKHIDHFLSRRAAEQIGKPLWFYEDFPYAASVRLAMEQLPVSGLREKKFPVGEGNVLLWEKAVAAYKSQISILWDSKLDMCQKLWSYYTVGGGRSFWQRT